MIPNNDNNNHSDQRGLDITDLPTDEYPILSEAALAMAQEAGEPGRTGSTSSGSKAEPVRAVQSLTHLEAEVSRLHAKWQSIDEEFKNREALVSQLRDELQARESTIAQLTADAERNAAAREAADERLAGKDVEIAALVREQSARDEKIDALSQEVADAHAKQNETLEKLAGAAAETTRLNNLLLQERATVVSLNEQRRQVLAQHESLHSKVQDLEIYINGRHDRWSELNAEVAALKDALRAKEETLKARDAIVAGHDEEKRQLAASIHDLERQCSELVGRRKEREEAYDELQEKLASHLAQAEQLRGEHASRAKETEQAVKRALESQQNIESLERGIKERDAKIEALGSELEQDKTLLGELTTAKTDLVKRVDELDKGVAERAEQLQLLRDDLRMSHEQLRLRQEELADRTAQLATNQEALDRKSREALRLTDERDAAQKEIARIHAELDTLAAHASELEGLRAEAIAEAKQLQAALAARNELVLRLETELSAKQATADLLERSVGRISDLGASLAALDERMHGGAGLRGAKPSAPRTADFVTTLAVDDGLEAADPLPQVGAESLPMDLDDGPRRDVVDVGEPTGIEAARKLVITIDGQTFDHPILKRQMTIGRGHDSDIRVPSHFVSRIHAKIRTNGVATIIEDAGSKNGVVVNSERVLRRVLRDGDIVTLGDDVNMRFVDVTH